MAVQGYPRMDNPFTTVQPGGSQVRISEAGATVDLDLATGTRDADVVSANEAFVRAAYADIIGRDATDEEVAREAGGARRRWVPRRAAAHAHDERRVAGPDRGRPAT